MPRGNWRIFSASVTASWRPLLVIIIGFALSVYLFIQLQPKKPDLPSYKPTYSQPSNYHPGGSECSPASLTAIRDIGKRARKSDDCAEQAQQHRLTTDDLIQQTRAADAAQAQTVIAFDQGWVALWATLGGLWTLIAAGLAAAYARDAAREGRRSADETREANRIANNAQRPWLEFNVELVWAIRKGNEFDLSFIVTCRNIGETVASNVKIDSAGFQSLSQESEARDRFLKAEYFIEGFKDEEWYSAERINILPRGSYPSQIFMVIPVDYTKRPVGFMPSLQVKASYVMPDGETAETAASYQLSRFMPNDERDGFRFVKRRTAEQRIRDVTISEMGYFHIR